MLHSAGCSFPQMTAKILISQAIWNRLMYFDAPKLFSSTFKYNENVKHFQRLSRRRTETLASFKRKLKTYLFNISF